jgi:hypothetical protein
MDTKEKDYDADAVLAELRESLKKINEPATLAPPTDDTITFNNITGYDYGINLSNIGAQDTITITSPSYNNTIINGGYSFGGFTATGAGTTGTYTIGSGASNASPWATTSSLGSTKIQLEGEEADIEINGKSLVNIIESLEKRLNVLVPNPKLEKEWNELKELGDKYRKLEAELKEKGEMWAKLKSMPPPESLY